MPPWVSPIKPPRLRLKTLIKSSLRIGILKNTLATEFLLRGSSLISAKPILCYQIRPVAIITTNSPTSTLLRMPIEPFRNSTTKMVSKPKVKKRSLTSNILTERGPIMRSWECLVMPASKRFKRLTGISL